MCINNNLIIVNNNSKTYSSTIGSSIIDLTFANCNTFDFIKNWRVEEVESVSDHKYIRFEYDLDNNAGNSRQITSNPNIDKLILNQLDVKYFVKKFDINLFSQRISPILKELNTKFELIINKESIDELVSDLFNTIIEICNDLNPKPKKFKHTNNWWNSELTEKRKLVNRVRRQYQNVKIHRKE